MRSHGLRATYAAGCRCDDCRRANREYARRNDRRLPANRHKPKRQIEFVPLEPLLARVQSYTGHVVADLTDDQIAEACGVSRRTVVRWRSSRKVRAMDTDRIATHLGWHPAAIWGADWYISTASEAA